MINPMLHSLVIRATCAQSNPAIFNCSSINELSSQQLLSDALNVASNLENLNLKKGDHIVLTIPCSENFCKIVYGCFAVGCIPTLLDPATPEADLHECVRELNPSLWISEQPVEPFEVTPPSTLLKNKIQEQPFEPVQIEPSDTCMMLYTTGTTGLPKGVPWASSQLLSHIQTQKNSYKKYDIRTEFVFFSHLAIFAIAMGRVAVIPDLENTQPNLISIEHMLYQMKVYGSDYVFASPALWKRVSEHCEKSKKRIDFIKVISTAGASVNVKSLLKLKNNTDNASIYIPYASTEVLMPICCISLDDLEYLSTKGLSSGKGIPLGCPSPDMNVEIISLDNQDTNKFLANNEIGQIVVSGPRVTTEYFKRPELTLNAKFKLSGNDDVWHKMGDVGYKDSNNVIWFLSRLKHVEKTSFGLMYPDCLEQYFNFHLDLHTSSLIYHKSTGSLSLVIPENLCKETEARKIIKLCEDIKIPYINIVKFPSELPTDTRHNSKIDRGKISSWLSLEQLNRVI
ncbi:AMP-binding protein [Neptunomonas phycophila]|uniref:AMP-binding protein n=3 Tax=Neptunomonas TaxID=75687 RepID=UPI0035114AC1